MTTRTVAERVQALYGQPGFETWDAIARFLHVPGRGSAKSLATGLKAPGPDVESWLELAEFRLMLPQAVANLAALLGTEPVDCSYSRSQAKRLRRERG